MAGDFNVTVEKLMLYWIPGIQTDSLKWIHQLDFATSGVLCVGLNRKASAVASSAFEMRTVDKQYLAVLQGHLDLTQWPVLDSKPQYGDEGDDESIPSKRKLSKDGINTLAEDKLSPLMTWQAEVKDANLTLHFDAFTAWKVAHCDPAQPATADGSTTMQFSQFQKESPDKFKMLAPLLPLTFEAFQNYSKQRKALRKFLKSCGVEVEALASEHSARPELHAQHVKRKEEIATNTETNFEVTLKTVETISNALKLPRVAQDPFTPPRVYRLRGAEHRLVINVPVAEIPGDFRMEPGHDDNPGKHCETVLEVLQHGVYQVRACGCNTLRCFISVLVYCIYAYISVSCSLLRVHVWYICTMYFYICFLLTDDMRGCKHI
jgi:hypothetical protein